MQMIAMTSHTTVPMESDFYVGDIFRTRDALGSDPEVPLARVRRDRAARPKPQRGRKYRFAASLRAVAAASILTTATGGIVDIRPSSGNAAASIYASYPVERLQRRRRTFDLQTVSDERVPLRPPQVLVFRRVAVSRIAEPRRDSLDDPDE
jgi:hypothetical protein